jgi:hypothetical protein
MNYEVWIMNIKGGEEWWMRNYEWWNREEDRELGIIDTGYIVKDEWWKTKAFLAKLERVPHQGLIFLIKATETIIVVITCIIIKQKLALTTHNALQ